MKIEKPKKDKKDKLITIRAVWFYGLLDIQKKNKDLRKQFPELDGYISSAKVILEMT